MKLESEEYVSVKLMRDLGRPHMVVADSRFESYLEP